MSIRYGFMMPHPPIIVEEVGRGEEKKAQATIDACLKCGRNIAKIKPDTIVLVSPHGVCYRDYFNITAGEKKRGSMGQFMASSVEFEKDIDQEFVSELSRLATENFFPAGCLGEQEMDLDHGAMVPLYFIDQYYTEYKLVHMGLSGLSSADHYKLGRLIKKTSEELGKNTVLVASGDLSHKTRDNSPYGYVQEGPEYDSYIMDVMEKCDFLSLIETNPIFVEKAAVCGHNSFAVMAGGFDGRDVKCEKLSYEDPFGIGYGVCIFEAKEENLNRKFLVKHEENENNRIRKEREDEDPYVRLARETVERYIREKKETNAEFYRAVLPEEIFNERAGVFVSLKKEGNLRGCIGTIEPITGCIAEEITRNAISASIGDPRFDPVEEVELEKISYSVDVLGEAESVKSIEELDAQRYGVIVSKGLKKGLLLPRLEGVDTPEEQIAIAKRKAGIPEKARVKIERFEVVRHF